MKNTIDIEDLMMELQSKANMLDGYMQHHDERLLNADYDFYKHAEELIAKISDVSRYLEQQETENDESNNSELSVDLIAQKQKMKVVVDIKDTVSLFDYSDQQLTKKN